jgi:hypothetical protein
VSIASNSLAHTSEVDMSISPESCMAINGWCNASLEVSWKLSKAKAVCLRIEGQVEKICFDKQKNNSTMFQIKIKRPVKVQLLTASSDQVLASTTLNVFIKEYKKRNRQRHAWSVIQ